MSECLFRHCSSLIDLNMPIPSNMSTSSSDHHCTLSAIITSAGENPEKFVCSHVPLKLYFLSVPPVLIWERGLSSETRFYLEKGTGNSVFNPSLSLSLSVFVSHTHTCTSLHLHPWKWSCLMLLFDAVSQRDLRSERHFLIQFLGDVWRRYFHSRFRPEGSVCSVAAVL